MKPPRLPRALTLGLAALTLTALACNGDDSGESESAGPDPDFPADYPASYVEVRNCRGSGDHDLNNIRILADPSALGPYQGRNAPFPEGAIVLKEEYDFADQSCNGPVKQWTVMRRLAAGSSPDTLGWSWQRVDAQRSVVDVDAPRCIDCHTGCGVPPEGYEGTCAVP
ncbi:MAG: cytochrome P460 family protein [Myxococcales bacterium]|nr:cytochrome P460 family protein [Myxococcales bacterium]